MRLFHPPSKLQGMWTASRRRLRIIALQFALADKAYAVVGQIRPGVTSFDCSGPSAALCAGLAPRAYVITPVHSNAVTITWGFYTGGVDFNGIVPIGNARGTYYVPIFSYYHSLNFFGRSANFTAALPYAVGNFQGAVAGTIQSIYRSGLLDSTFRFSVNLMGGPAMQRKEIAKWKQKRLLGVSLKMIAPTGQYSGTKLINWGVSVGVQAGIGYSERWGHWVLDGYAGAWFYTTNTAFYAGPVTHPQSEAPIFSLEGHLSYDVKPRLWLSLDGNFWECRVTS